MNYENKVISISSKANFNRHIYNMQCLGYELLSSTQNSSGDYILTLRRDLDMPEYNKLKEIEKKLDVLAEQVEKKRHRVFYMLDEIEDSAKGLRGFFNLIVYILLILLSSASLITGIIFIIKLFFIFEIFSVFLGISLIGIAVALYILYEKIVYKKKKKKEIERLKNEILNCDPIFENLIEEARNIRNGEA